MRGTLVAFVFVLSCGCGCVLLCLPCRFARKASKKHEQEIHARKPLLLAFLEAPPHVCSIAIGARESVIVVKSNQRRLLARRFAPLLLALLDAPSDGLRCAAAELLTEIAAKRMDAVAKLTLVSRIAYIAYCSCVNTKRRLPPLRSAAVQWTPKGFSWVQNSRLGSKLKK